MSHPPVVTDRSEGELFEDLQSMAAAYTDSWEPGSDDPLRTLLRIYARFGADLFDRLNEAPEKHRLAFLDALGTTRHPPTPASVPVTIDVADGSGAVTVPEGARVLAESDEESGSQDVVPFEIESEFRATSASLSDVFAVDPADDRIVDHGDLLDGEPAALFEGDNCREPALYLGDDLLALEGDAEFVLETMGDGWLFGDSIVWEYYGKDGTGTEGWRRLERLDADGDRARFRVSGEPVERSVDGVETFWVRCRPGADADPVGSLRSVSIQADPDRCDPDAVVVNDVPLSTDGEEIRPFGRAAQPPATWYVASRAAFTTPGGTAAVRLEPPAEETSAEESVAEPATETEDATRDGGPSSGETPAHAGGEPAVFEGPPSVSWEYYNGSGWTRIEGLVDGTDALREAGTLRFPLPDDLTETMVAGEDQPWIRGRLVSGSYGGAAGNGDPPQFGGVTVGYEHEPRPVATVRRRADAAWEAVDVDGERGSSDASSAGRSAGVAVASDLDPFPGVEETEPTVYFGFDEALAGGPLTLFVAVDEAPSTVPGEFEWEASTTAGWQPVVVEDGTQGFTREGIVELSLPAETTERERFGRRRHWLRARTRERPPENEVRGCSTSVIEGIHTNARWAEHGETTTENLGRSDGTPGQTVTCSRTPALDPTVEIGGSERSDGHVAVDGLAGTITLNGDGAVPDGAVRVTYRTGGGTEGNVDAGAVTKLDRELGGVEAVTNPVPATGGTDAESVDELRERAASQFRHRGRAVTAEDYEQLTASAVRAVGAVTCLPSGVGSDDVTVVIAPEADDARPVPSTTLRERVAGTLRACAPARAVAENRITVRGPAYVPLAVDVTVRARQPAVQRRVGDRLETLLHPTSGNDGAGWSFGTVPEIETVESVIATVDGVEAVLTVDARLHGDDPRPLSVGSLPPDALVCNGEHRVSVEPAIGSKGGPDAARRTEVDH